jgi:hypothetical protein
MIERKASMRRGMILPAVLLASHVAFSTCLGAQRVRMTATVLEPEFEGVFEQVSELCPRCREGAAATLEFTLTKPEESCAEPGCNAVRLFVLGTGGNTGTVSLGGETWPLLGTLWVEAKRDQGLGSIWLDPPRESRPVGGIVRANLHPWLAVDFPVIPMDGGGRLIAVSTTAHWYDNGNSHMGMVLCRGESGEGCVHGFGLRISSVTIHPGAGEAAGPSAEGQRDKARRLACAAPDGSVGKAAICPNLEAWYIRWFGNACSGNVGDFYQEHADRLNAPATDRNIEIWAEMEAGFFQHQEGCTGVIGSAAPSSWRIDQMKKKRDGARN